MNIMTKRALFSCKWRIKRAIGNRRHLWERSAKLCAYAPYHHRFATYTSTSLYLHHYASYALLFCLVANTVVSVSPRDHERPWPWLWTHAKMRKWCPDQFKYAELNGDVHFFYFWPGRYFLGSNLFQKL